MFEVDETQRMVESAVLSWCETELAPMLPALESGEVLPYELLRKLCADLGVSEMLGAMAESRLARLRGDAAKPKAEDGGGTSTGPGGDPMLTSVLLKEISRVSPGVGMVLISSLGCAMTILERGSAKVIERHALPILRQEKIGAWALTEPSAGSDAFGGMRTAAVPDAG